MSGSTITVVGTSPSIRPGASKSTKSSKKPTTPKTTTIKVATSSSTTYSQTQSTTASSLAVGDCVSAIGPSATNGSVTASTVRITGTSGSTCSTGGFRGGAGFGG